MSFVRLCTFIGLSLLFGCPTFAQQLESAPPPKGAPRPSPTWHLTQ